MSSNSQIISQFLSVVRRQLPGGRLLVCVSGGADSMAMFHALRLLGADLRVVHCNFHLRGKESDRDEAFVKGVCRRYGVDCYVEDFDVNEYSTCHGVSVEMACRELRYDLFRRLKVDFECSRITVAHNNDDNVETMLLNLFRGSGIRGLAAMQCDNGEVLRPLLSVTRREIELFMSAIGEDFIVDSSNLSNDYRRNYIRNSLIPMLEGEWPGIRKALRRTQANVADALAVYDDSMSCLLSDATDCLSSDLLDKSPSRAAMLHEFLKSYSPTDSQIREMAACNENGACWRLNGVDVVLDRSGFRVIADGDGEEPEFEYTILNLDEKLFKSICSNRDRDVIYLPLPAERYTFREWRVGDRIKPLGMRGSQLVSDVIKDAHLSPQRRRAIRVLEDGESHEIVWVAGIKRSRYCLLSPGSTAALRIRCI